MRAKGLCQTGPSGFSRHFASVFLINKCFSEYNGPGRRKLKLGKTFMSSRWSPILTLRLYRGLAGTLASSALLPSTAMFSNDTDRK
jgi:hypothetical protein